MVELAPPRRECTPPRRGEVNYNRLRIMWKVYILRSEKFRKFYIGCTNNLERRIKEHNSGYNKSTCKYIPFQVVYTESYSDGSVAFLREKKIKSYKGGNAFKKLLE